MRLPGFRWSVLLVLVPLALLPGCEKAIAPYQAEFLEIYNHHETADGEENTHHIRVVTIGVVFHESVDIPPGESQVFDILWPGHYRVDVEFEDGTWGSWQDPPNPVDINDAETTLLVIKY